MIKFVTYKWAAPACSLTQVSQFNFSASFAKNNNFHFPRHKELFNTEYYEDGEPEGDLNHDGDPQPTDEVNYDRATHGPSAMADSGVLSSYKKQINLTAQDHLEKDYWDEIKNMRGNVAEMFDKISTDEREVMKFSKAYKTRLRLRRDVDYTEDFRKKYLTREYGNYSKYELNKVEHEINPGVDETPLEKFTENYHNMMRQMSTFDAEKLKDEEKKEIEKDFTELSFPDGHTMDRFIQKKGDFDYAYDEDIFQKEKEMLRNWDSFETTFKGRMSPFAKETLYRKYLQGMTVKDLSLKFGIMPQRVKAIIYQKHLYWVEVYPKLGETHQRMALEMEVDYAAKFPFVDYGSDLHIMAEQEKGFKLTRLTSSTMDSKPHTPTTEKVEQALHKRRSRGYDKIPLDFIGRGTSGYLLYEINHHRGASSPQVNRTFQDAVRWTYTQNEGMINPRVAARMKIGGPRFAQMGKKKKTRGDGHSFK